MCVQYLAQSWQPVGRQSYILVDIRMTESVMEETRVRETGDRGVDDIGLGLTGVWSVSGRVEKSRWVQMKENLR